jgi:GAF domain-containing protein
MKPASIPLEPPPEILKNWQEIVNLLASIIGVPAALVMRLRQPDIEVLVSSQSEGNPYRPGAKEHFENSGLYCETVIKTLDRLLVPDALADEHWKANPDIKLGMVSYLGFPIRQPGGEPFGTICLLDRKENAYSAPVEKLMSNLRDLIESHLLLIYMNKIFGERNQQLTDYLMELQALRGIVPICTNCKSIRDAHDQWRPIEDLLIRHPAADFSHTVCPECAKKVYPDV